MATLPIGVSVREGVANGASPFLESDKHVVGILMERERGVPNKPIRIATLQEDRKIFGGVFGNAYGSYMTRHIFNNAGTYGATIYGVRIVGDASTAAQVAVTYDHATNQAWVVRTLVSAAATQKAKNAYYPTNVEVGDIFTFTLGSDSAAATATVASPANIVSQIVPLINANAGLSAAYTAVDKGDYFEIEAKVVNVAIAATTATTPGTGAGVALMTIKAGFQGEDDPGTWANNGNLRVSIQPYGAMGVGVFGLQIFYKQELVEQFTGNTMQEIVDQVNSLSYYINISSYNAGHASTSAITATVSGGTYAAPSGESAYYPVASTTDPKGLACLDGVDVQLIAVAEHHTATMALQVRDYCATRNNAMGVVNLPQFANDAAVQTFSQTLQTSTVQASFIAAYNVWVRTSNEAGGFVWTPSIGCVLGAGYIRVPQMNRDQIWIAPAGLESVFTDCIEVAPENLSQATIDLYVKTYTTNVVTFRKGSGNFLLSSRTMSTNPLYTSVHIRRFTNFLYTTFERNSWWVVQKQNTPELKKSIVVQFTQYGQTLYNDGGLETSVPFDEAWKVICDISNNPRTQDRKQLNVDIYWIPAEITEAFRINLLRNDGTLIVSVQEVSAAA